MSGTCSGLYHAKAWALGGLLLVSAASAPAAPPVELASGVSAGVGIALDAAKNHLYYVEFSGGTLKRIQLDPACELAPPCPIATVANGFIHPEDVAVNAALGMAYVTTRDDPGTTGALWRVDLATGVKSLVSTDLGAPHQIVLDPPTHTAYVVGFDSGILWQIDLTTGAKAAAVSGLGHPVGLAIDGARARAFVSEQDTNRVAEYDLAFGTWIRDVAAGLTAPFYLAWTDAAELSLYVAERHAANRVTRLDLTTGVQGAVVSALPLNPSGAALNPGGSVMYLTTDGKVLRAELAQLSYEPVFLGVGHVPAGSIAGGYATTDPTYFFRVKHSPFGGTLNIFGNLSEFGAVLKATHYRVLVSRNSGPYEAVGPSWTAYRWNSATQPYVPVTVAPVTADLRYEIPPEYSSNLAARWYPPFLMMRWPSSDNGSYNFKVEIYDGAGSPTPIPLPVGNSLTLEIDNTRPQVDLGEIRQHGTWALVEPCAIVSAAPNLFSFEVTAADPSQHLLSYNLTAYWGKNRSAPVLSDSYASHENPAPPHAWTGVIQAMLPASGWPAQCNCAHTFILRAWKRTIDGYNYTLSGQSSQSFTINNTGKVCN